MDPIRANEIEMILRGRIGLISGPELSLGPNVYTELSARLAREYGVADLSNFLETAEACLEGTTTEEALRDTIRGFLDGHRSMPELELLAKVRWSAVLSASLDIHLENRLQRAADRRVVSGRPITVLDATSQIAVPPPRTVPVYKLLGNSAKEAFVLSSVQYRLQRTGWWRTAVRGFADRVKGTAVLCVGMSDCTWLLEDLLAELVGQPTTAPSHLLLLSDDPLRNNPRIERLLRPRTRLVEVRSTLGELAAAVEAADRKGYTSSLPFHESGESPYSALHRFGDWAVVVNEQITTETSSEERERLLDLLFAPTIANWAPFVHDLDFRRSLGANIASDILGRIEPAPTQFENAAIVVTGSAATGKTVMLKRVAIDLAVAGRLVLWLRLAGCGGTPKDLRDLFDAIARHKELKKREVVLFVDDPLRFAGFSPREIRAAAQAVGIKILLVLGVRTIDRLTNDSQLLVGPFEVTAEYQLSDELDDDEWARLPTYLVKLGIAADDADALIRVKGVRTRLAQDTLSLLYYLLPGTRAMIASSIKDEFFRLGDRSLLAKLILGAEERSTGLLRDAYGMVAVAESFGSPLPIEVLVSTLGVDYDEWLAAAAPRGPAWGILYPEVFEEGETICYRTRNAVVTDQLVRILNGGSLSRSGEISVMIKLLNACTGSQAAYREFCVKALVPFESLQNIEFQDGVLLYDAAMAALPYQDRTILHHKGLWLKERGGDPIGADRVFSEALAARPYPYAPRFERDENIYTSMAANTVLALEQGKIEREAGKQQTLTYLNRARSPNSFDPRAVHVQANLIVKLASREESRHSPDTYAMASLALSDVDRALLLLKNPLQFHQANKAVELLEEIREQVFLAVGDIEEMKLQAIRIWEEHGGQQGFVLVARKLYQLAWQRNRGRDFRKAYEYCLRALATVTAAERPPATALRVVTLHIYYRWQIQRRTYSGSGDPITWEAIRDHSRAILDDPEQARDPLYRYLYGLALAHLDNWTDSRLVFDGLRQQGITRDLLWEPRDYLLNEDGVRRRIQVAVKRGADRTFLYSEELGVDFHANRADTWPIEGEVTHAYVEFSFAGPRAMRHTQED
jgi:hypothetical protein